MATATAKCPYCGAGFQGTRVSGRHVRSCKKRNTGAAPPPSAASSPGSSGNSTGTTGSSDYHDMYRKYRPTADGDHPDVFPERPSKWTQRKRAMGLQTRSASRPSVKVSRFSYRGVDYTIEQHPTPIPVVMSWHNPNSVDYTVKDRRTILVQEEPGVRRFSEVRWIAARGHYGTTEGGDAEFAGNTKAEVESAIRTWIDEMEKPQP